MKPKPRKGRWLLGVVLTLGLLAGGYFFFQSQVIDTRLRPIIEQELTKAVHSPVSIESVRGGLTGDVVLNHVSLTLPGSPWETRFSVDHIAVKVDLIGLLFRHKPVEQCLERVDFKSPRIVLAKKAMVVPAGATPVAIPSTPQIPAIIPFIPVPRLTISGGSFSVQEGATPKEVLNGLNFDASSGNGTVWGLQLYARPSGAGAKGSLKFNGSLRLDEQKARGVLFLDHWPLVTVNSVFKELAGWEVQGGTIDVERMPLVFKPGQLYFDAVANLEDATLQSPKPLGIVFSKINGRAFIRPNEIKVPNGIRFQTGDTPWNASGTIPLDDRPLSVETRTTNLALADVFNELLKTKNWKVDGRGTATLTATGPLKDPVINGLAELGISHVGNWQMDSLVVSANYAKGVLSLVEAKGKLYSGQFSASGSTVLTGGLDAPVSLKAFLTDLDAKQAASALGWSGTEGKANQELQVSGTVAKPFVIAKGRMDLTRTLRHEVVHYSINNSAEFKDQRLELSVSINDKAKLEAEMLNKSDRLELQKLSLVVGKKARKLSGKGTWPKSGDKPIDIQVSGEAIALEELPFFNDQFPDFTGKVSLRAQVGGTGSDPKASVQLSSPSVRLGGLEPQPFDVAFVVDGRELNFQKLAIGERLSGSGPIALSPEAQNDFKATAHQFPIQDIASIGQWNNPPQPFSGSFTGKIHVAGSGKNPLTEGDGSIESLKIADWSEDRVEGTLSLDKDRLLVKKLRAVQGERSLSVTGAWDTRPGAGTVNLKILAHEFQLAQGPYLSADLSLTGQTKDLLFKDWSGTLSAPDLAVKDLTGKTYKFNDFSMNVTSVDSVIKGKMKVGKNISGASTIDLSVSPLTLQAYLKIGPVALAEAPEITQFLPRDFKVSGTLSGDLVLKKGPLEKLPMKGSFVVVNGSIPGYDFDRVELAFEGEKSKIFPSFSLVRDQAHYKLSGSLVSNRAFWDPNSVITINGPMENERLINLFTLLGFDKGVHKIVGQLDGNVALSGTLSAPVFRFDLNKAENLRFDNNIIPAGELHFLFSYADKKGNLVQDLNKGQRNYITLQKGQVDLEKGGFHLDPDDATLLALDLAGSTKDISVANVFNFTSHIQLNGKWTMQDKEGRPTFDGVLSVLESGHGQKNPKPFALSLAYGHKVLDFRPRADEGAQLVGRVDFSQDQKVIFNNLHLEHSAGSFSVDGILDLKGESHLTSDAENIPIEEVGKWVLPKFPLKGTGHYHLILDGPLSAPILTTSFSIGGGTVGELQFDLLDGELRSRDNTLFLGTEENPIVLSRKKDGAFSFTLQGKMPIAFTSEGWAKIKDKEMDITAQMDKGDFGLILLAGIAKEATGDMDFSARVTGTLDDPVLTMDLGLQKCRLVPSNVAREIADISGRIKVRNNRLAVEDLNGRIGQGRVFLSTPPVEDSKIVLVNFIPQYLDFRVRTVGDHGVFLHVPDIMRKNEWGEVKFYGQTPDDPLLVYGPLTEPHVKGTALLETGHYTFPPVIEEEDNGEKVEFRELASVVFNLNLVAGKNTWYSNDFESCYLELQVDPGDQITLVGKDADRTPDEAGIKCFGTAGSSRGWMRYLGSQFDLQQATLRIPKGKPPSMQGHATHRLVNVDVISAGGVRKTDVDIWVDFKGTFGRIDFTMDSSPKFDPLDKDIHQKILLSYVMFNRDLTGYTNGQQYTSQQLQTIYSQQNGVGALGSSAIDALNLVVSQEASRSIRPFVNNLVGGDVNVVMNALPGGSSDSSAPTTGVGPTDALSNSITGQKTTLGKVEFVKPINRKLSLRTGFGLGKDQGTGSVVAQPSAEVDYKFDNKWTASLSTGVNDSGQEETKIGFGLKADLPEQPHPIKGDTTKPHIRRFDILPSGVGKYELIWETEKYAKSEVRVFNSERQVVQFQKEKIDYAYDHQMVIENLKPDQEYIVQILVKDANGNEDVGEQKIMPIDTETDEN